MKNIVLLWLCLAWSACTSAQTHTHQNAVNHFIRQFNNGQFEQIYESYAPSFQKARSRKYHLDFLKMVKKQEGRINTLDLYDYRTISNTKFQGHYTGLFEFGTATVRITTNARGEIVGLYIKKMPVL